MSARTTDFAGLMAVATILCILFYFLGATAEEVDVNQQAYCEMVSIWKSESHLAPEQRAGWPDYKGNYNEVCK